jgi:uncharacterized protein (TIGR02117 family)
MDPQPRMDRSAADSLFHLSRPPDAYGSVKRSARIHHALYTHTPFVWIKSICADPISWLRRIAFYGEEQVRSRFLKILVVGIMLVIASLIIGTITPRPIWQNRATSTADATKQILMLSNPIHTDIAIPVDDAVRAKFGFLPAAGLPISLPEVRFVIFGWGGRAFYSETPTWSELKALPTFKGLTLDSSVMHVEIAGDIDRNDPSVTVVNVTDAGMAALADAIRDSFASGVDGPVLLAGLSYGQYDAFFEAKGYFNALFGCNTWTAAMLRQAGISTGWWEPLPILLRMSLQLHNNRASFAP